MGDGFRSVGFVWRGKLGAVFLTMSVLMLVVFFFLVFLFFATLAIGVDARGVRRALARDRLR